MIKIKWLTIAAVLVSSSPVMAKDFVYLCTLRPFNNAYIGVGYTEQAGKRAVKHKCESDQGESSLFCRANRATCEVAEVFGRPQNGNNVTPPPAPSQKNVVIYQWRDYLGAPLSFNQNIPDLSTYGLNDKMRSFSIPQGWEVRFFVDANYRGDFYTRKGGDYNADGFEAIVSSIKILKK